LVNALAGDAKIRIGCTPCKGRTSVSLFDKPKKGDVAVKAINHLGDEVMKVFRV
jgi:hypothetical protein